jgi:hypothetical protein
VLSVCDSPFRIFNRRTGRAWQATTASTVTARASWAQTSGDRYLHKVVSVQAAHAASQLT